MPTLTLLLQVVFAPRRAFERVADAPSAVATWVVPLLAFAAAATLAGQVVLTTPPLATQYRQMAREMVDARLAAGSISGQDADRLYTQLVDTASPGWVVAQAVVTASLSAALLFALTLFYWLLGRSAMGGSAPFIKVMEVAALTLVIGALELVATAVLMTATGTLAASPSLALLAPGAGPGSLLRAALGRVNLFTLWNLGVASVGLAVLYRRDAAKVAVLLFGLWGVWSAATLLLPTFL